MSEGLAAQISSIVRQHLVEAHHLLGELLARLDGGGADLATQNHSAPRTPAKEIGAEPTVATPMPAVKAPKPSTLERKARLLRAKQRQKANGTAGALVTSPTVSPQELAAALEARGVARWSAAHQIGISHATLDAAMRGQNLAPATRAKLREWLDRPQLPPAAPAAPGEWPTLRQRLKDVIRDRGLTHAEIGRALDVQTNTVAGYLAKSHQHRSPGDRATARIATWFREGAVVPAAAAAGPPFALSPVERDRLAVHLSLAGNSLELRETFGANRELLTKAAAGEHLASEVIAKLRDVLANGAAG